MTAHLQTGIVKDVLVKYCAAQVACKKWRREARTYTSKVGLVTRFLEPVHDTPVGAVTSANIDACCKAWDTPERSAEWTRRLGRVRARAFFTWCLKERLIKAHPMTDRHHIPKPKKQGLTMRLDDTRVLRAVLDPAAEAGDQRATFVLTALLLGARTSEVQSFTRRSFDDGGRVVSYVDAKDPGKVHRVRLPQVLQAPLRLLAMQAGSGTLFPTRGLGAGTWGARAVRHWAAVAGLEGVDEMDVRMLRRTNNTLAVEAGVAPEVVARETQRSLQVVRSTYVQHGAETTGRAAAMEEATREVG